MRSIKSELYLFIKTLLMGGDYDDNGDITSYSGVEGVKSFMFWNSELNSPENKDGYQVPAVFLEYTNVDFLRKYQNTSQNNVVSVTEDRVSFILHVISPKITAELREEDYLAQIDLVSEIYKAIQDKSLKLIKKIKKVSGIQDNDNRVLMDWELTFEAIVINCGDTDIVNANDQAININAPVEQELNIDIEDYPF